VGYSDNSLLSGVTKNKLQTIGHWIKRRMIWICGIGVHLFNTEVQCDQEHAPHILGDDVHN
jgi:hypothetical protein